MSTKNYIDYAINKKIPIKRTLNNKALVPTKSASIHQEVVMSHFKNYQDVKPGGKTDVEIDFSQTRDTEKEKLWLVRIKLETSDTTNHPTFLNDIYAVLKSIEVKLNDSKYSWRYEKNIEIKLLRNETFKEYSDRLYEKKAESDNEFNAISGVQVTNSTSQYFYINLFDIYPHFKDQCINGIINKLNLTLEFEPEPSGVDAGVMICKSNTTANAYAKVKISFNDIDFLRVYEVVTDPIMLSRPPLNLVVFDIPYFEHKDYDTSWTTVGTDEIKFSVSDVFKIKNFKKLVAYVVPDATAYNDATACMTYSGHNYITWCKEEKAGGSNRKKISFLADTVDYKKRLRAYEIERHRKTYGKDLPMAVHANSDNWNKYYLFMTEIYFDEIENSENTHETFSDYDSEVKDYTITFQCSGSVSATSTLHVVAFANEYYKINPNTLKIEPAENL